MRTCTHMSVLTKTDVALFQYKHSYQYQPSCLVVAGSGDNAIAGHPRRASPYGGAQPSYFFCALVYKKINH